MSEMGEICVGESKSKRRKIEESKSEKSSLIPRSCSFKKSQQEIEIRNKYGPQVGDTLDILHLLFSDSRDFLIKSNGQKVKVDQLVGKTIVVCMLSLAHCCRGEFSPIRFSGNSMLDLVEAYNELRVQDGVEFVFVPKRRGLARTRGVPKECSVKLKEECFNSLFSKMPWPAVPFSDKQACHRIEKVFWPCFLSFGNLPYYAILDRNGRVLLTNTYNRFKTYSQCHCHPKYLPLRPIFHLYGGADLFSLADLSLQNLRERDKEAVKKLDLDQLLASPSRDFLLARDGTKVAISSLRNKVVGLYFRDNKPTPRRLEAVMKVYHEAMDMGYDFEIVQINFHFPNDYLSYPYTEEMSLQVCCENIPWLTLPFKDICCRRLRRLFKLHKDLRWWRGDTLVIIDPNSFNVDGTHLELFALEIIKHFGIEAYPFTRFGVFKMERARLRDFKLHKIFPFDGPPLIRPSTSTSGGFDQVPRSQLFGKKVFVLFDPYYKFKRGHFQSMLEYKYRSQSDDDGRFEVVYVSCDSDESTFDEVVKEMPWLVHPYSLEFGKAWTSEFGDSSAKDMLLTFNGHGELVMEEHNINKWRSPSELDRRNTSYPFNHPDLNMMTSILENVEEKYMPCTGFAYW